MLYQVFILVVDIGLGALAYRLAKTNVKQIADLVARLEKVEKCLGLPA